MTKFLTKAALAATIATGLFVSPALAANTATAPFVAKAKILKPLTLVKATDLDFGTITMGAALSSSNVVVARSGGSAATACGANLTCTVPTAGSFDVTGVAFQQLNVTIGTFLPLRNTADLTKTVSLSIDNDATVTLDNAGLGSFDIGGSITVLAATADGDYTSTVPVTVTYQ
jgi:hypothetical protein